MADLSTEHARIFFSSLGFTVEDIPTAGEQGQKRADLRVLVGDEEYVVEAKARDPHREWHAINERADAEGFATASRDIQPWWLLSKRIAGAYEQLVSTPMSLHAFRILWIVALHGDDKFVISCFERQLLGLRLLFAFTPQDFSGKKGPGPRGLPCYYFEDSDFERFPLIDAAMLCTREGGQLLVNHFSHNRSRFRGSRLFAAVQEKGAVVDAEDRVRAGRALMLGTDFTGPRGNGAQQAYLRDKYDVLVSVAQESHFSGVAVFPLPADDSADTQ